jgi:hypothetical protein
MEPIVYLELGVIGLAGLGLITAGALRGWRGWLELKHLELQARGSNHSAPQPSMTARIELADLKERIRKLEAIAAGVDI